MLVTFWKCWRVLVSDLLALGTEYIDQVTLASGLVIGNQSIGVASISSGITSGLDGILG